jgi:hypothetical protein
MASTTSQDQCTSPGSSHQLQPDRFGCQSPITPNHSPLLRSLASLALDLAVCAAPPSHRSLLRSSEPQRRPHCLGTAQVPVLPISSTLIGSAAHHHTTPPGHCPAKAMAATPEFTRELDSLTAAGDSETRSELIRKAVALYVHAREQESHGRKLGFFVEENGATVVKQVVSFDD